MGIKASPNFYLAFSTALYILIISYFELVVKGFFLVSEIFFTERRRLPFGCHPSDLFFFRGTLPLTIIIIHSFAGKVKTFFKSYLFNNLGARAVREG